MYTDINGEPVHGGKKRRDVTVQFTVGQLRFVRTVGGAMNDDRSRPTNKELQ